MLVRPISVGNIPDGGRVEQQGQRNLLLRERAAILCVELIGNSTTGGVCGCSLRCRACQRVVDVQGSTLHGSRELDAAVRRRISYKSIAVFGRCDGRVSCEAIVFGVRIEWRISDEISAFHSRIARRVTHRAGVVVLACFRARRRCCLIAWLHGISNEIGFTCGI